MPNVLNMPKLGLTMTEGSVADWPLAPGESFSAGQVWAVVETDKVTNELEAPAAGKFTRFLVEVGETVEVGHALAEWEQLDSEDAPDHSATLPEANSAPSTMTTQHPAVQVQARTPTAAQLVAARRLTQATQDVPHFYLSTEIRSGALKRYRAEWNARPGHAKVSVTHLFVAALAHALATHRELNTVWQDERLVTYPTIDIGIAVHTAEGLAVPVLRAVDQRSLAEIAQLTGELVERARSGKLDASDVGGAAMSISNAGMHDVTAMTSIIPPGQCAIFGVGSERACFRPHPDSGLPTLSEEITTVLSCDHRVLDGVSGLRLLNTVRGFLEQAEKLFA